MRDGVPVVSTAYLARLINRHAASVSFVSSPPYFLLTCIVWLSSAITHPHFTAKNSSKSGASM